MYKKIGTNSQVHCSASYFQLKKMIEVVKGTFEVVTVAIFIFRVRVTPRLPRVSV